MGMSPWPLKILPEDSSPPLGSGALSQGPGLRRPPGNSGPQSPSRKSRGSCPSIVPSSIHQPPLLGRGGGAEAGIGLGLGLGKGIGIGIGMGVGVGRFVERDA
jgi:hypothetical protein